MDQLLSSASGCERTASDKVMIALRKIIQAIDRDSKKMVKRAGLTGPQLVILREISRSGVVTVGEIARAASLSQATVTGILERMEKRGLLARYPSELDKRRRMVRISPTGEQILRDAPLLMQEAFVERFSAIQEWEQSMILSALQRLVSLLEAKSIAAAPFLATSSLEETETGSDMPPSEDSGSMNRPNA